MKRAAGIILIMSVLLTGCDSSSPKVIESHAVAEESKPVFVMAGIIDANEKAQVTSKLLAKVTDISVEVGSVVQKGDLLIRLDTKDIEAQVAQAQAAVNTAQANVHKMEAGARPEQISQAESVLESAKINLTNTKYNFERNQKLLAAGAVSQAQFETVQSQLAAAQAQYNSAQSQLNLLVQGESQESLNVLRAQVAQSQAALEIANIQLANGTILSPISGIVSAKNIQVGELASPNVTIISVVNVNSLYVKASLPDGLIGDVNAGEAVVVKVPDLGDQQFKGTITMIDPVIDSRSKSVLVRIALENHDSVLKPGMLAEIGLIK